MSDNTTDFFDNIGGGAGAPSAQLKNVGDFVHGEVADMFKRDYVPYGKTEPEKYESGATRQQLVVLIQTNLRNWQGVVKIPRVDPSDSDSAEQAPSEDDGKRAIYCPEKSNIQYAVGRAVQASKSKFEVGGTLGVKIANLKDTGKGNPLKEHEAVYKAKPAATGDEFFGEAKTAPAAAAPVEATPAPAAAAPVNQDPWATSAAPATEEPPF